MISTDLQEQVSSKLQILVKTLHMNNILKISIISSISQPSLSTRINVSLSAQSLQKQMLVTLQLMGYASSARALARLARRKLQVANLANKINLLNMYLEVRAMKSVPRVQFLMMKT